MRYAPLAALGLILPFATVAAAQAPPTTTGRAQLEAFFETRVRPVFAEHCSKCHGAKKQSGGLRLDRRDAVMGGAAAPVVPGHPEKSLLLKAVRHEGDVKMPPKGKLPPRVIDDLATWIKLGAPWPATKDATAQPTQPDPAAHWAFRPVRQPPRPAVKDAAWPANVVDYFVLAQLEAKGLRPNPPADRRTLLRRLKFDLLGLPATYEEVRAFEADTAPDAYAKVVERYLASPHYGERWGRHWLDVARYADSKGYVFEEERRYPYAYAYRDWVVRALNDDLSYDQFVQQQLAADRLAAIGQAPSGAQAAMGFLTLGRRFLNNQHDIIDDRIDVVTRGLLGLTVSCARCHDHKYDPIPQRDYYSLYGVFASSTEPKDLPLVAEPAQTKEYQVFKAKLGGLEKAVADYRAAHKKEIDARNRKYLNELRALQRKVDGFKANSPAAPPRAMILADLPRPREPHVFLRGNPNNPGPSVPRQFLAVLAGPQRKPFKEGSGRLELARAIASKDNPLTARVLVNRVWLEHFGRGLVTSPSDFGLRSDPPSHPALLDWLAATFVKEGWSLKKLHRQVVLSRTYQQSSAENASARAVDPENRLLARANRRRLDFEALRDSLLSVAGHLDARVGGPAVDLTARPFTGRRTLYGFVDRQNLPGLFRTFDFANPDATSPQRYQTTVPQQPLYLMNNPFALEQARALLRRPEVAGAVGAAAKIRQLHRLAYARDADADEVSLGVRFVTAAEKMPPQGAGGLTAWERYGQVLLLANEFTFAD